MPTHFGAWLAAPPIPALGLHLSNKEFQVNVKYRLWIAVYDQERKCPYCSSGTLDTFGDHAVVCHGRGDAISEHDTIRDQIASLCSAVYLSTVNCKRNRKATHAQETSICCSGHKRDVFSAAEHYFSCDSEV